MGPQADRAGAAVDAAAIAVSGLVKRYPKGQTNALDDLSFTVRPGEAAMLPIGVLGWVGILGFRRRALD